MLEELWTAIVPAWLGGVGGLLSAIVAGWALVTGRRSKSGVDVVASRVNSLATDDAEYGSRLVWWRVVKTAKPHLPELVNIGQGPAENVELEVVTPGAEKDVSPRISLPRKVEASDVIPLMYSRSLNSPGVAEIRIKWQEGSKDYSQLLLLT